MKPFPCTRCGTQVFFENTSCGQCYAVLGYVPDENTLIAFDESSATDAHPVWARAEPSSGALLRPCANRLRHGMCNWMIDAGSTGEFCLSCSLNLSTPDPSDAERLQRWAVIESAKRRLVVGALRLGLRLAPKVGPDDDAGLGFHIRDLGDDGKPVLTGHASGAITIQLSEADDVHRETVRASFQEPWRTVLGHMRHEFAHYIFHRWLAADDIALASFRCTFGDERADYAEALSRHHSTGAPAGWEANHVSAYASSRPHEDWAETCAHLLLIVDAVDTASAWGLRLRSEAADARPQEPDLHRLSTDSLVLEQWLPVAQFLNAMHRSLGLRDSYPFLLTPGVVAKMRVACDLLRRAVEAKPAPLSLPAVAANQAPALAAAGSCG